MTIDNGVQANLSLGVLQFLDLDPSFRNKYTARLNDVSIVRVNDFARLTGPPGHRRLHAALKAGSITITASHETGLGIAARAAQQDFPVIGRGTTGGLSTFTIEAKDMFFAYRVSRQIVTASKSKELALRARSSATTQLRGLKVELSNAAKSGPNGCAPWTVRATFRDQPMISSQAIDLLAEELRLPLASPMHDGRGGLYEQLAITGVATLADNKDCAATLTLRLIGQRLEP